MAKSFWTVLIAIFTGLGVVAAINGFLYSLGDNIQRWDYLLANAFVLILILFAYLIYEVNSLKKRLDDIESNISVKKKGKKK